MCCLQQHPQQASHNIINIRVPGWHRQQLHGAGMHTPLQAHQHTHTCGTHTLEAQPLCPAGNPACSPSHLTHPIGPLPAGFSSVAFASKCTHIYTICIPSLGQTQKLLPAASTKHMGCDPWPCYSCWHASLTSVGPNLKQLVSTHCPGFS